MEPRSLGGAESAGDVDGVNSFVAMEKPFKTGGQVT